MTIVSESTRQVVSVLNLSRQGAFISGEFNFSAGDRVYFQFFIRELEVWVGGEARVTWNRRKKHNHFPAGLGVEFIDFFDGAQFLLAQFIGYSRGMGLIEKLEKRHERERKKSLLSEALSDEFVFAGDLE